MSQAEAAATRSYVIFRLGPEEYGLPIHSVNSIIRFEQATPVPRSPEAVIGVINLRGRVIPDAGSRIVVSEGVAGPIGVAVDSASEVAELPVEEIRPVPESILSPETAKSFEGVIERDGALIILLNLDEAVPHAEYADAYDGNMRNEGDSDV